MSWRMFMARCRAALVLAAWACVTHAAHATDPVIGSASLAVTGLHYSLIDLDPNDGITPWITFTDALKTHVEVGEPGSPNIGRTVPGAFPPPFTLTSPSTLSQVTRTADGFTLHIEVRRSDLDDPANWPSKPSEFIAQRMAQVVVRGMSASFTMSPHTRLLIEGQMAATASIDMASLTDHPLINDPNSILDGLHGRSGVYVAHTSYEEKYGNDLSDGSAHLSVDQDVSPNGAGAVVTDESFPSTLSFGLPNKLGIPIEGRVEWSAVMYTGVFTTTTAIPEPGAFALVFAGLGVVGLGRSIKARRAA